MSSQSNLDDILSFYDEGTPVPRDKFDEWSKDPDLEVQGALCSFIFKRKSFIAPPLTVKEYQRFALPYWERCIHENQDGEWTDTRFGALYDLNKWFKVLWESKEDHKKLLMEIKTWFERMYREGDEDIRSCLTLALDHMFVKFSIIRFFKDWQNDPLLKKEFELLMVWRTRIPKSTPEHLGEVKKTASSSKRRQQVKSIRKQKEKKAKGK